MKTKLFLLAAIALTLSCCNKDEDPTKKPIDLLPPATQTGEQTFGCLINGEAFVPPTFGNNAPSVFYQFVDGAYTFGISGRSYTRGALHSIIIGGLEVPPMIETAFALKSFNNGNFYSLYDIEIQGNAETYYTNDDMQGILTITHFDQANFIISGTFSFTVLDADANEINITNGRFDMNYTN